MLDKRALTRRKKGLYKKDVTEAKSIYNKLIKDYPKLNSGYFGLVRILLREKNKKAFDIAKAYIKISKDNAYYMYIGHSYLEFDDLKNAEKNYLKAYPYIKNHYGPDYALAMLYLKMNKLEKAKKYAKLGISKFNKMPKRYKDSKITRNYIDDLKEVVKK